MYVFGLLFLFIYNVCTGIFNAMGDSRTPLILLVLSSVGNVILDMVFVAGLHWGVDGVAWATFIAQGASGILAFVLLLRRVRSFDTGHHFVLFAPEMLRRLTNYAVPSIAQQSFVSVSYTQLDVYKRQAVFFLLVLFAALTSSISLMETLVSVLMDKAHMKRKTATIAITASCLIIGMLSCLGYGPWATITIIGMQFLDFFDFISNSVLMPICLLYTSRCV